MEEYTETPSKPKGGKPKGPSLKDSKSIKLELTRVYKALKRTVGDEATVQEARALTFILKTLGETIKDTALEERLKKIEKQLIDKESVG